MRLAAVAFVIIFIYLLATQNKLNRILNEDQFAPHDQSYDLSNLLDVSSHLREPLDRRTGLSAVGNSFKMNGKPLVLISGAIHYFRIPKQYWHDRLMKAKAMGLNVVETYVPWNLHESEPGKFDFSGNLDLKSFVLLAQDIGMLVIVRPGPYICSEWEFGGLPSWLLADKDMRVRTMNGQYIEAVNKYFDQLLPTIKELQYKKGGPVIAVQIDNEYGSYFKDQNYLPYLNSLMTRHGITELKFLSDSINGLRRQTIEHVLKTVNFKTVGNNLVDLKRMQPNAPMMVMEFWTGWFDWWGEKHHTMSEHDFEYNLEEIFRAGASVNFYMFHGGTNFGFMNGAFMNGKTYQSDITSYDYDALLTESGDITPKYRIAQNLITKYFKFKPPHKMPESLPHVAYPTLSVHKRIPIWSVLNMLPSIATNVPVPMEMLPSVGGKLQSYGYVLYRTMLDARETKSFVIRGFDTLNDRGAYFINQHKQHTLNSMNRANTFKVMVPHQSETIALDVLVENGGRTNWEHFDNQRKGLQGPVSANDQNLEPWTIYSLEMQKDFIDSLFGSDRWTTNSFDSVLQEPTFFKVSLYIDTKNDVKDTFIDMTGWGKGVVFVNGENLGRYWNVGPQYTLYLPAPYLKVGENQIVIFEEATTSNSLKFSAKPNIG